MFIVDYLLSLITYIYLFNSLNLSTTKFICKKTTINRNESIEIDFIKKLGVCLFKSLKSKNFMESKLFCEKINFHLILPLHQLILEHKFVLDYGNIWISTLSNLNSTNSVINVTDLNVSDRFLNDIFYSENFNSYDPYSKSFTLKNSQSKLSVVCMRFVYGWWSIWSKWETCTRTCNGGMQVRRRRCKNYEMGYYCVGRPIELQNCMTVHCPETISNFHFSGFWSSWSNWSRCTTTCGFSTRSRQRVCRSPVPCMGLKIDWEKCHLETCPIHGKWSPWSDWTTCELFQCSDFTSLGRKWRSRECKSPKPRYGGLTCPGDRVETAQCQKWECQKYSEIVSGW